MTEHKKQVEIYQRIKKENPCVFCLRSDGGCQLKGNKCDSTSLKMYYERNHLEIESILKDIYIKELEKENEQLKVQNEKMKNWCNCQNYLECLTNYVEKTKQSYKKEFCYSCKKWKLKER